MCNPLHYFVNIRIVEVDTFEFSFGKSACNLEVFNSTGLFTLAEALWQCRGTVNLNSGGPELVGKLDLGRVQLAVSRLPVYLLEDIGFNFVQPDGTVFD